MHQECSAGELANLLGVNLVRDSAVKIFGVASLQNASVGRITFCVNAQHSQSLQSTQASAVITSDEFASHVPVSCALLLTNYPEFIFAKCAALFKSNASQSHQIHPTAVVGQGCVIADGVSIGPHCVIGDNVSIGAGCVLHARVTLYHDVRLGERVEIHSGSVIGADGFGFVNHDDEWYPVAQLGSVVIGNDVSIGALTSIDRGALDDTVISNGVKIDNQVQIGHNVRIGEHTVIAGCCGIAGSAVIGKRCRLGGNVCLADHVEVTDDVSLAGRTSVTRSITKAGVYMTPGSLNCMDYREGRRNMAYMYRLNDHIKRIAKLEDLIYESTTK